jgi:hypothetical protein
MTLKSHFAVWAILATSFNTHQKTIDKVNESLSYRGELFFLIDLPKLGKEFERSLEEGQFECHVPNFKMKKGTRLLRFMYEHFSLVFDDDGLILPRPCVNAIIHIRQLCLLYYKFEMPFTPEQEKEATLQFIEKDARVKTCDWPEGLSEVSKTFQSLFPEDPFDIRMHHASGATADKVCNPLKRSVRRYIPSLMKYYDATFFFQSLDHAKVWSRAYKTRQTEPSSTLTFVPKTSSGPRGICMEPHERMYAQKGLQTSLYDFIENHSPAKGYVNFTDQTINNRLAQKGSLDRSFATIDLKDASDMVSWDLILKLSDETWREALTATRSATVRTSLGTIEMNKFAPMGSALCFPIEAMLFWSIAKTVAPEVWVYGDDIIVANEYCNDVIVALESYGLIVNRSKTLHKGLFRESCGGDFYAVHL